MPKKSTNPKAKGKTSGLGIGDFIATLFEANELRKKPLTDEQIAKKILAEFPDKSVAQKFVDPKSRLTINAYRTYYNQGRFTKSFPPEKPSFRRDSKGRIVEARTGRIPLLPEQIKKQTKEHAKMRKEAIQELL